jgi:hypothetical protein
MATPLRVALLCIAGALLGIAGNGFTPHRAPIGAPVVPSAEQPGAIWTTARASPASR